MANKKDILISLVTGIYLSLMLFISTRFPPIISSLPLATGDALPQNFLAVLLDHMRIAFDSGYGIGQSAVAFLCAWFLFCFKDKLKWCIKKYSWSIIFLSGVFGVVNVFGLCMYWLDCLPMFSSYIWMLGSLLLALGWAIFFFVLASLILYSFDTNFFIVKNKQKNHIKSKYIDKIENHLFGFSFLIIILAWFPWILSYYPASMDNDVFAQLYAFLCEPNNHHPWFSSCILGLCYKIGSMVNDNFGIFIYILGRDIILALIYAKCVVTQKKMGLKNVIYYPTLLFFAITPIWGAYAKHAFKDTFSAGLFCLYTLTLITILYQIKSNTLKFMSCIQHGTVALFTSLFRNNCIYAIFPATIILLGTMIRSKQQIKYIVSILITVMFYFGYNHYIINYEGVKPGSSVEAFSIPFQQTARTVKYYGDSLTEDEKNGINALFQYEQLANAYNPILSDPVKNGCVLPYELRMPQSTANYLKTWAKMLFHYPIPYVEAAVGQSYGYYAFTPNLPEQSGNWNSGMTVFDWIGCNSGYDKNFQFHYIEELNVLRQILHAWVKVWDKIPVLCLTDICAFYTWISVLLFYYLLTKRYFIKLIPLIAVGVMILTCMASPVNDCFRYFSPVAASFPALFILLADRENIFCERKS